MAEAKTGLTTGDKWSIGVWIALTLASATNVVVSFTIYPDDRFFRAITVGVLTFFLISSCFLWMSLRTVLKFRRDNKEGHNESSI